MGASATGPPPAALRSCFDGYIRNAEPAKRGFGEVFPALPTELFAGPESLSNRSESTEIQENRMEAPGIEPGSARLPDHLRSRA